MTDEPLAPLDEFSVFVNGVGWLVASPIPLADGHTWIDADHTALRALYGRYSFAEMGRLLGRSVEATAYRCRYIGLTFASLQDRRPKADTKGGVA